jgi:signal transduction histidine kinase
LKRFYDKQFLSGEENSYNEFPAITADGREIWFGQNVQIINDGGVVTGFQAVARNITERKQSESAMAFARDQAIEANRLKSQLLAKVSHELRIPLSAILGFAELLRDNVYGQLSGRQKSAITEIIDSTDYLAKLIEDLLFEAQVEAKVVKLNKEPIALDDFIRGIERNMSILARNKKLGISFTCSGDPPATITGDRQRLQQVMVNLIGNAIKFTKTGDVRVRVFCPDPDHWSFDVSDTGIGIPDEVQNKIFEPFRQVEGAVTEENRGTGLGLAITQQLVELMGGDIKVSSKVKVGSTFTVTLPNR